MIVAFDGLLIIVSVLVLSSGLKKRWAVYKTEKGPQQSRDWPGLVAYLLHHGQIRKKPWTGLFHLLLVWGFCLNVLVVFLDQIGGVLLGSQPKVVSLLLDITGVMMLVSTIFFLIGRGFKETYPESGKTNRRVIFPLVVLLLILLSGFLAEGFRLSIQANETIWTSPIGTLLSQVLPDSPLLMQLMIRLHFYLVLIFLATLPFTFMRHVVSSAANILNKVSLNQFLLPKLAPPEKLLKTEQVENISRSNLLGLEACVSCGRCVDNCPAAISGKPLLPGNMMQQIVAGWEQNDCAVLVSAALETAITPETAWSCTQCLACLEHCPVSSRPMDLISFMRRHYVLGKGQLPEEARHMMRNLDLYGDAMGKGSVLRTDWLQGETTPLVDGQKNNEKWLLWVGCSGAFHPRYSETLRALVKILNAGNIQFEILGKNELCCGEPARRLGGEKLFRELAQKNITQLKQHAVQKILTSCPHCYQTLKNEYPDLGGHFRVTSSAELIADLIQEKQIELKYPLSSKQITIHDPCYLGRGNKIYEPLRSVCDAIPDSQLTELPRSRENGFCCGGGGGHMWLHENQGTNINLMRAEEVQAAGVDTVATACPFCMTMLEDGISSLETENPPKVLDLIDLVAESLKT
ncbi:MAG: (Fe-S)-binding protein [SAR324 cluster bacterium]|nr:(Fe-S)-binding protein [SAR324 cluster bacterium]